MMACEAVEDLLLRVGNGLFITKKSSISFDFKVFPAVFPNRLLNSLNNELSLNKLLSPVNPEVVFAKLLFIFCFFLNESSPSKLDEEVCLLKGSISGSSNPSKLTSTAVALDLETLLS